MITNYIKTTIRFISRNISFTIINLLGLTAGITAFLLIALYLQNELGYDCHTPDSNRLYRLVGIQEPAGLDKQHVAITGAFFVPYMRDNLPQVEDAFRIMFPPASIIEVDNKSFGVGSIHLSEGNVLQRMGYPLLQKSGDDLLDSPNQAMVSRIVAERLFNTADVVGKTFKSGEYLYTITAVFENENINSHFKPEVFLSFSTIEPHNPWLYVPGNNSLTTYVLLHSAGDKEEVERLLNDEYNRAIADEPHRMKNTFYLQPW
jgi:putative ABC transport system permease protein